MTDVRWLRDLARSADGEGYAAASHETREAAWDQLGMIAPDLARLLADTAEALESASELTRQPIDLNYIAIYKDDWEILMALLARVAALNPEGGEA